MSSSSSDHQQQLSILQDEIATLKAQKEGLARIATQTLSVLRAQPLAVRPKGIWIQEGDQAQMEKMEGSLVQLDAGKAWRWAEVRTFALCVGRRREAGRKGGKLQLVDPPSRLTSTVSPPCCPKVNHIASSATKYPLNSTPSVYTQPRPEITPFRRFFPLEILEAIVDLCNCQTKAIFAQSSLACLEIFAPRILQSVDISGQAGLKSLFASRVSPAPDASSRRSTVIDAFPLARFFLSV